MCTICKDIFIPIPISLTMGSNWYFFTFTFNVQFKIRCKANTVLIGEIVALIYLYQTRLVQLNTKKM